MPEANEKWPQLPSPRQIHLAISIYLRHAYGGDTPRGVIDLLPPEDFQPRQWLMSDAVERDPGNAPLHAVRSFMLRLGNAQYPHMKLRLSRTPREAAFMFSVDAHDAFLLCPVTSPDYEPLQELKRFNAAVSAKVLKEWDAAGLPTERNFLRQHIRAARQRQDDQPAE